MLFVSWVVTKMEEAGAESLLRSAGSNKNSEGQMCLCASVSARDTSWLLDTYQGKSALAIVSAKIKHLYPVYSFSHICIFPQKWP